MELIYIGDPMCSWCYGFGKALDLLVTRFPTLDLRIVVGGLRASATDVLDDAGKQFRLQHWARVEQMSGLPFNRQGLLDRKNFVYDTEPVCRAVVAARGLAPEANILAVFRALQHAFYVEALDTTDGVVLAEVVARALKRQDIDIAAETILGKWSNAATVADTQADFTLVRSWNITSFPVLALRVGNELHALTTGYTSVEMLERRLAVLLEGVEALN
ncbi:DsbA family protein (plasmid) [Cupriavidus sp. KK10]|uniref:DsbA family protein n=1 Tax=Cupriavidus sp. KK10 TaxID=1478019 RepID=UPI001BA4C433|nr:DsbA family protein [Cupriavidus sp. KK10]QUN32420.1 DsbA family protein [Cupriavidus sp. KK10]